MPYCPRCGEELSEEVKFCPRCGTAIGVLGQPSIGKMRERGRKGTDMLGVISAGVVLIVLAVTYLRYPIDPSIIGDYFENMAVNGHFIKPPLILFDLAIFFFNAVGVWGIVLSGLRIALERSVRKAIQDLTGGSFSFFCAFLLTNYSVDVFTWQIALAYFIIAIGLLVTANSIIHLAFPERYVK